MPRISKVFLYALLIVGFPVFAGGALAASLEEKSLGKVVVDADSMEADNSKRTVHFKGNVVAKEDFTLCSDELKISYNENNEVVDITATGKVKIFQKDKTAKADKVVYNRIEGTMLLTGTPSLSRCGDVVTGERIVFNVKDESAFVEASSGGRVRAVIMPEKDCSKDIPIEENFCPGTR